MLDSGLLISWAESSHDRQEEALLRLFSEVVAYSDRLLQEARISGFEPFVLGGHGDGLRGFMILRGTPEQINTVSHDDEFLGYLHCAERLMKHVGVEELYLGEALRHMLEHSSTKLAPA
jgi:hypothetical protein